MAFYLHPLLLSSKLRLPSTALLRHRPIQHAPLFRSELERVFGFDGVGAGQLVVDLGDVALADFEGLAFYLLFVLLLDFLVRNLRQLERWLLVVVVILQGRLHPAFHCVARRWYLKRLLFFQFYLYLFVLFDHTVVLTLIHKANRATLQAIL